jgi:hypothetical protein
VTPRPTLAGEASRLQNLYTYDHRFQAGDKTNLNQKETQLIEVTSTAGMTKKRHYRRINIILKSKILAIRTDVHKVEALNLLNKFVGNLVIIKHKFV